MSSETKDTPTENHAAETVSAVKLTKKGQPRKPFVMTDARKIAFEKCRQSRKKKLEESKPSMNHDEKTPETASPTTESIPPPSVSETTSTTPAPEEETKMEVVNTQPSAAPSTELLQKAKEHVENIAKRKQEIVSKRKMGVSHERVVKRVHIAQDKRRHIPKRGEVDSKTEVIDSLVDLLTDYRKRKHSEEQEAEGQGEVDYEPMEEEEEQGEEEDIDDDEDADDENDDYIPPPPKLVRQNAGLMNMPTHIANVRRRRKTSNGRASTFSADRSKSQRNGYTRDQLTSYIWL